MFNYDKEQLQKKNEIKEEFGTPSFAHVSLHKSNTKMYQVIF